MLALRLYSELWQGGRVDNSKNEPSDIISESGLAVMIMGYKRAT
jgi:hypothetical protein